MRLRIFAVALAMTILIFPVISVSADTPVVCVSGAGNASVNNYNLPSQCGAPAGQPVYVEVKLLSGFFSSGRIQLTEGAQSCDVYAAANTWTDCAVTVFDGVLDAATVSNNPQNYRLIAQWDIDSTPVLTDTNVYTTSLSSGDVLTIRREFDYGDIAVGGMLFFGVCMLLVALITRYITGR